MNAIDTVQQFIGHIFSNNMDAALALVAPDAQFIPARTTPHPDIPIYASFHGPEGARAFFGHFAAMLEPKEFTVTATFSQENHVAMYGKLHHLSRKTGRDFISDWALICRVEGARVTFYHFYEDTVALEKAVTN